MNKLALIMMLVIMAAIASTPAYAANGSKFDTNPNLNSTGNLGKEGTADLNSNIGNVAATMPFSPSGGVGTSMLPIIPPVIIDTAANLTSLPMAAAGDLNNILVQLPDRLVILPKNDKATLAEVLKNAINLGTVPEEPLLFRDGNYFCIGPSEEAGVNNASNNTASSDPTKEPALAWQVNTPDGGGRIF